MEQVLANAEEKIMIQPGEGGSKREIRILINRDMKAPKADEQKK
jgi:hypothetical protein